jgi:hypothetical protein
MKRYGIVEVPHYGYIKYIYEVKSLIRDGDIRVKRDIKVNLGYEGREYEHKPLIFNSLKEAEACKAVWYYGRITSGCKWKIVDGDELLMDIAEAKLRQL